MNNKAQVGIVGVILLFLVFFIIWLAVLAPWITEMGQLSIQNGQLSGVEAFFVANLNLFIFIAAILGLMGWMYFGGSA